jgi:GntR family transcriptional repressor for pyruvate dehydrogenase complex
VSVIFAHLRQQIAARGRPLRSIHEWLGHNNYRGTGSTPTTPPASTAPADDWPQLTQPLTELRNSPFVGAVSPIAGRCVVEESGSIVLTGGESCGMLIPMTSVGPPLSGAPRLTELITERLLALMRSGHLKEGSKLPPERDLADMLGVSRTMVREALSALRLAGLVERRPGMGTVITRIPGPGVNLDGYVEAGVSIIHLLEARMAVELGIVHVLCEQRRDPDFVGVIGLLDSMRLAVRQDLKAENYILPSLDFHLAIASATEQPVIIGIKENLLDLMRPHLWLLVEKYDLALAQRSLALHERMFAAIQDRDVIRALAEVKSHYQTYPLITGTTRLSIEGDEATVVSRAAKA